jgi:hypothetical protein
MCCNDTQNITIVVPDRRREVDEARRLRTIRIENLSQHHRVVNVADIGPLKTRGDA